MRTSPDRQGNPAKDPPRTAFVLSGGGNQGVSQVGMLRGLIERGIVPDVVVGTSAGALNGAVIAAKPSLESLDRLQELWTQLESHHVFPGGRLARTWNIIRRDLHLFRSDGLADLIERALPVERFDELEVPLRVVAADTDTGEEVIFAHGLLKPALLASAALPGVYPLVQYDNRQLMDGAVVNTVPLWHALSGPVERVYVCNVSGAVTDRPARSPLDVVLRAFAISRNQRFELELRHVDPRVEVIVLPRPIDARDVFDFSGAAELIEEAHRLTSRALDLATDAVTRRYRRRWFRRPDVA